MKQIAIQMTPEVWDVMNLQGNLAAFFETRVTAAVAQDFAAEAVHQFMMSPSVKEKYGSLYATLTTQKGEMR